MKHQKKLFFHKRMVNYWSKVCREVLESTSPADFKNKEDKDLSGAVRIQLTLLCDTRNTADNSLSSTQTSAVGFHVPGSPCASLSV